VSADQPRNIGQALIRLATLAENAGKHRTADWHRACLEAFIQGTEWPPAPRYKGPLQDLDALTDDTLVQLQSAIVAEQTKRGVVDPPEQCISLHCQRDMPHELTPECPWSTPDRPWRSPGGAGQWNG